MSFNSFEFLLFFPAVCVVYYCLPSLKSRQVFLLLASYYFYMSWQPAYLLLLMATTAVTYLMARAMCMCRNEESRRLLLISCISLSLGSLFFFKYFGFFADNVESLLGLAGISMNVPGLDILLPVGISFYTFQSIGYIVDVYKRTIPAESDLVKYALFVSFFPQLVAGPIERAANLLPQFDVKQSYDDERAVSGLKIMMWGYFLKLVVADRCALYVDAVFGDLGGGHGHSTLIAAVLFCFQLYGDFAGYSSIAIGAARIMGFSLMDNFKHPYFFSTTVQDYWKRNHISLTTWLMDYLYYPLAERRDALGWWCFAILVTFLASGFWHGAAWTFVVWGLVQGVLLVVDMLTSRARKRMLKRLGLWERPWYQVLRMLATFMVVCLSLVLFRADSLADAVEAYRLIFSVSDMSVEHGLKTLAYCVPAGAVLFVKEYVEEYGVPGWLQDFRRDRAPMFDQHWLVFLLVSILVLGVFDGGQFIYFQF